MAITKVPVELSSTTGIVDNSNATAITIDSSENVLTGKTSSGLNTAGVEFASSGRSRFTRDGNNVAEFNRKTSDGSIVSFNKDASAVGVIGTVGGSLAVGGGDVFLEFNASSNVIQPMSTVTGGASNGLVDLGASLRNFKDLYLSGKITLGDGHQIGNDGTDNLVLNSSSAENIVFASASSLFFNTGASSLTSQGTTRVLMSSNGNVGIGNTSPDAMLRIDQDANSVALKVTGGGSGVNIAQFVRDVGADASIAINASSGEPQIQFNDANTFAIGVNSTSFEIADNGHIGTNTRFVIDNTGNTGIGTTSPAAKLHISGNSDVSDEDCQLIIDDVDGSAGSRIPSIQFRSNTGGSVTNQARIRGTGTQGMVLSGSSAQGNDLVVQSNKVGIGTTSPTHPLHISIAASNDTIDETKGLVKFQSSGGNGMIFGTIASSPYTSYIQSGYVIDTSIAQYNISLNPIGGNVGIGTTAPAKALHVVSAANQIRLEDSTNNKKYDLNVDGDKFMIDDMTAGVNRFAISGANVGIGETAPLGKLHVKSADSGASADGTADELIVEGSGDSGLSILSGGSNYGTILFSDSGDSAAGRLRYEHNNNALNFGTNGSWDRMYINSSGNVGIGDTSPGHKLDVAGNINLSSGTLNLRDDVALDHDGSSLYIKAPSNLYFYAGNSNRGHMDSNGKLILLNGNIQLGASTDYHVVKGVYRKTITVNKNFTAAFNVNGSGLASQFRVSICGVVSNTVVNARYEVLVNHYKDCLVQSLSGDYTETKIKIVSNNNEDCTVYIGADTYNGANITLDCEVETFNNEEIDFDTSTVYDTVHFIHTGSAGASTTSTATMTTGAGTTTAYS